MIIKSILILHRYLGVVLGVLMTVWCLSGFVMMYQGFPEASRAERMAGLETLDSSSCCGGGIVLPDAATISSMRIEMLAGAPVMRLQGGGAPRTVDLNTREDVTGLDETKIRSVISAFAAGNEIEGDIKRLEQIRVDQWTAQTARRQAPVWRAKLSDPASSWVYASGQTGEVFQHATLSERWLSWFGAVPHWLYPTILRENQPLWYQSVIWLALAGTFLTVTGLVVGISKLRGRSGRWFPYRRPMWMWHHAFGFFAGVLVLTWVFSGLLTMSPWGLFQSPPTIDRSAVVPPTSWGDVRPILQEIADDPNAQEIVQIRTSTLFGETSLIAEMRDGQSRRYSPDGLQGDYNPEDISRLVANAPEPLRSGVAELLETEDAYYYGHKQPADLPVLRVQLADEQKSRIYIDPASGDVHRFVGATQKRYRWLESGFHSFDFPVLKERPIWDIAVLLLLAVTTVVCATGAWLSITRVRRDITRIWPKRRRS